MSIKYFTADELANLAAVAARKGVRDAIQTLASYSRCNAQAYNRTYRDRVRGHTAAAIHGRPVPVNERLALQTARQLVPNAKAPDSTDFLTAQVAKKLLTIVETLLPEGVG